MGNLICQLIVYPFQMAPLSVKLYRGCEPEEEQGYYAVYRRISSEHGSKPYCVGEDCLKDEWSRVIPEELILGILDKLKKSMLSTLAQGPVGLDGSIYEIHFGDELCGVSYRWWLCPPKEWSVLGEFAHLLLGYSSLAI